MSAVSLGAGLVLSGVSLDAEPLPLRNEWANG